MTKKTKLLTLLMIIGLIGYFTLPLTSEVSFRPDKNDIIIGSGEFCPVYEPKGEVLYNSSWTGELPSLDDVTEDYRTATFGLG